jgi:hypothetical protein
MVTEALVCRDRDLAEGEGLRLRAPVLRRLWSRTRLSQMMLARISGHRWLRGFA